MDLVFEPEKHVLYLGLKYFILPLLSVESIINMGGKHLKRLRTERAKVKLKKKPLPKGQNITDTTFKVKKIILVEQLKKVGGSEPVSSRNVPLKVRI